jgi:hypothetical protein
MKKVSILGTFIILAMALSAGADFTLVRTIGTPYGTERLTGLDNADGALFAVAGPEGEGSCLYLIDPANGDLIRAACPEGEPPGCPGLPLHFVSCALDPCGDAPNEACSTDAYWVGDNCGDLIEYSWTEESGLVYSRHCLLAGVAEPVGLAYRDGYVHVLDHQEEAIYRLTTCGGALPDPVYLPNGLIDPSALAFYDGSWFVSDSNVDVVYEIGETGELLGVHLLEGLFPRTLRGMTFIGDELFVASDANEILVYRFGTFEVEVPEGDSVYVEPVPDGLGVTFPTVSDSGSLCVYVSDIDPCPPPEGVRFLPDFYEIITTAAFEYAAQIAIMTDEPLPAGVNPRRVRIFARPSGDCMPWRDITVAPLELVEPEVLELFGVRTRTLSDDDQFSVFILGVDRRNALDVIENKFMDLEEAIEATGGTPIDPYDQMMELLERAHTAFVIHGYPLAARLVDRIAEIALATPEIPHTYDPDMPDGNIGGRIVARAHTLAFSLRLLLTQRQYPGTGPATYKRPDVNIVGGSPEEALELSPNPSSSGFTISLSGGGQHPVSVGVYSVRGELIRTLLDGAEVSGQQTLVWDGRNTRGVPVAAGTYFVVVTRGENTTTKKIVLQR